MARNNCSIAVHCIFGGSAWGLATFHCPDCSRPGAVPCSSRATRPCDAFWKSSVPAIQSSIPAIVDNVMILCGHCRVSSWIQHNLLLSRSGWCADGTARTGARAQRSRTCRGPCEEGRLLRLLHHVAPRPQLLRHQAARRDALSRTNGNADLALPAPEWSHDKLQHFRVLCVLSLSSNNLVGLQILAVWGCSRS